ncbi:hydroxymethylglutaryl-CoA lyase [Niveispirillum cyanobacteriorum]|uniref:Hydroxymethylglutaryl-CoA lyase n=1 Tax=Niveispirillum cyanobacteriorum TaxID=1612173 RepID=A0A2K9NDI0_9PROT|nr:hydroxymethylglutaryl-CoA lyase [Niveispirillum cyanobacteriorum]AUN31201.1 hydroxymethylglutaryl-CoA lyase [Niveispirillum cyanobacteriorum]GGE86459.1 hydroxymethylglutaryl-CoA lyase [Niveispirillum cyanobacteriorum]
MSGSFIELSEVGPRDGLQSISPIMPTEAKKAWIAAEAAAGVREIEVGSFVPAKILPQLADTAELVAFARTIPGLTVAVLVPNLKGAEAAVAAGAHKITIPLSVSETHSLRNVRRTHAQMLEETAAIAALIQAQPAGNRPKFEGGLSTAFGCTLEGVVPESRVLEIAEALMKAGCDEVGLSDTTGYANPAQVKRLIRAVRGVVGDHACSGVHLHNTRGLGLANALAALDEGVTTLDASLGGIGGCPFAPGASGNIVTEDLAFMLAAMGYDTGIDLEKLLAVREIVTAALPDTEMYGFTPDAGLPKGFRGAWGV